MYDNNDYSHIELPHNVVNVVSISMGRTSVYTTWLVNTVAAIMNELGNHVEVDSVFMDTGAEDVGTYQFAKDIDKYMGINVNYLRLRADTPLRTRNNIDVVNVDGIGPDLKPFHSMCRKYSTPSKATPFCTPRMKTEIFNNYCVSKFGKRNYVTWLGIRCDEPARMWGQDAYKGISKVMDDTQDICDMYTKLSRLYRDGSSLMELKYYIVFEYGLQLGAGKTGKWGGITHDHINAMLNRIVRITNDGIRYLGEISDFDKQDILDWWAEQEFDLGIDEHLGNCVFCIKKSDLKLALAQRDRPEEYKAWMSMCQADDVRVKPQRTTSNDVMYRMNKDNKHGRTLPQIIAEFADVPTEVLRQRVYKSRMTDTGSCSESCEMYNLD